MSTVNRSIYPNLGGDNILFNHSYDPSQFTKNELWDDSCAISKSTRPDAPFNSIGVFAHYNNTEYFSQISKQVQKIGLWLTITSGSDNFLSSFYQYRNRNQGDIPNADPSNYAALAFNRRGNGFNEPWTTYDSNVHQLPEYYRLITGINFKYILGVICCSFRDGHYCSLSYYNEHKNTLTNPTSLFMRILFNWYDNGQTVKGDLMPFDLEQRGFVYYQIENDNATITKSPDDNSYTPYCDLYPPYWGGQYNVMFTTGRTSPYKMGTNGFPPLLSPLIGCAMNGRFVENNDFVYGGTNMYYGHYVFGGVYGEDYTLTVENGYYYPVITQQGLDKAISIASTYGIPFSADFPATWDIYADENLTAYIPIANEDGYFNGDFELLQSNGAVNPDLSEKNQTLWDGGANAPYDDRYYNPNIINYVDEINMTEPTLTAYDAFNRSYIIDRNSVDDIGNIIWSADDTTIDLMLKGLQMFGENPINGIINLKLYPFDVRAKIGGGASEFIKIGRYNTQIAGIRIPENAKCIIDVGTAYIKKFFNNFLDYEPFTQMELYIPFMGTIPLSPQQFSGKTISIKLIVDFITGACCAVIYAIDNNHTYPVLYKNGVIGIEIPLSGNDAVAQSNAILHKLVGAVGDTAGIVADAGAIGASGGALLPELAPDMINKAVSTAGNVFGAASVPTMYQSAGSATPQCGLYMPLKPYLIIYTVEPMEIENYSHLIGNACYKDVIIGNCHGLSMFDNIELNINATETEKNEIYNLLRGGVYV